MELIFATNNMHKVLEVQAAVGNDFQLITLRQAGIDIDIPEPHPTLQENAREKSAAIFRLTGRNCFSEDTGLEVDALNGEPGVKTARYAGEGKSTYDNISKLLQNMEGKSDRSARFRTVVSLILEEKEIFFEGICEGKIVEVPSGREGFGYDPVFSPGDSEKTFAEMSLMEKGLYSHRKKAMDKLVAFLHQKDAALLNGSSKI